ncbi:MAG: ABC transporter permease [Gemmatimonadaceae bacterium]|nr:ABC transporter permease [Gemmatimonadaceae bacterium]
MISMLQDLRYVARSFSRTPGFFVITALTLALGIGATTAIFSVVNGVLLQPLPYPRSDQIVQLLPLDKNGKNISSSEPNFEDWQSQSRDFSSMAISSAAFTIPVNGLAAPARAQVAYVRGAFFPVFGLTPAAGRTFGDAEMQVGAAPEAVVSSGFAQRQFGTAAAAIGRTMTVDGKLVTIAGVMAAAMNYPAGNEVWLPHPADEVNHSRSAGGWRVIARLRDGTTPPQASREISALSRRMKQEYGDDSYMSDANAVTLREQLVGNSRTALFVLLGASAFLLLISCANVVNLLVARMSIRREELSVRVALGASQLRLVQQLLTESALLSLTGGLAGMAIAAAGIRVLIGLKGAKLPRVDEIHMSVPVLLFAIGISLLAALGMGLLTAWQGTRRDIRNSMASSQRTQAGTVAGARIRKSLVVSQMALTVVLLIGAGVLSRSFVRLLDVHPGYRTDHAVILDATLPYESGDDAARRRVSFYTEVMEHAAAIPGVRKVGASNGFPLLGGAADGAYIIMTSADEKIEPEKMSELFKDPARSGYANFQVVDGAYFEAMNIPVLSGRAFRDGDSPDAQHVGVVSASLAKAKWPNESPIGKVIEYGNMDGDPRPFTVVGVVGDVRDASLAAEPQPTFYAYLPQRAHAAQSMYVVMQTAGDAAPVMAAASSVVRGLRPDVSAEVRTMETIVSTSVADRKFLLLLVGVFGGAALFLATLGVYSVISYIVAQRGREISVRIALGAQRGDVLGMVLRQGVSLAITGILVGAMVALALTRLLTGLVYGVSTTDPIAYLSVIVLIAVVALVASWLPARRAAAVDPMDVLRGS